MATMKDVAQLAGVSTATVSRALMNPEKVSSSTRKRVEDAVLEAGYSPNSLARNLRRNEDRKSTRLNSSHSQQSRMPSSA